MRDFKRFLENKNNDLILSNLDYLINDVSENFDLVDLNNKLMLVYFKQIKHYYEVSCLLDVHERVNLCDKLDLLNTRDLNLTTEEIFKEYNDLKNPVRNSVFYFDNYVEDKYHWKG